MCYNKCTKSGTTTETRGIGHRIQSLGLPLLSKIQVCHLHVEKLGPVVYIAKSWNCRLWVCETVCTSQSLKRSRVIISVSKDNARNVFDSKHHERSPLSAVHISQIVLSPLCSTDAWSAAITDRVEGVSDLSPPDVHRYLSSPAARDYWNHHSWQMCELWIKGRISGRSRALLVSISTVDRLSDSRWVRSKLNGNIIDTKIIMKIQTKPLVAKTDFLIQVDDSS